MSMLPPGYPYPAPAGQPLTWPSIAPTAASALQQSFAYPGSFPMVRPSSATLLPNGTPLHHPSSSPWPSLQMPYASHPAAAIQTMPNMNSHQLSASHQLVSGPSMSAGLAAPPFMWDTRFLPQTVGASNFPQAVLSASFGGPTASGNSTGGVSMHSTGSAHQLQQQQQQQQQLIASMGSSDSASAAAAIASAAAALSARQQGTSQLSGYLAERHLNSNLPIGHPSAQAQTASPSSSGAGFPYQHAATTAASTPSMMHHTISAFNTPAHAPVLAPPAPRPTPPPPQPQPQRSAPAPASIRTALGPTAYSAVRSLMLEQQSTYVQQLFELHKLCQLQQLLTIELQESASMDVDSSAAAAANDAGTAAAVTEMKLLSHAPSAANQHAQDAGPACCPEPDASAQRTAAAAPVAGGTAVRSTSSLSDDGRPAQQEQQEQQAQRHLGLSTIGNLPKAIRKVIDGRCQRFPGLATQSRSGASVGVGSVPGGVVRPLPLYLVPCDHSGGDLRPSHSIQATVQQQLLDVDHRTSSPHGDQEATTPGSGADRTWASTKADRETGKQAPPRRASAELLGLVGGTWRYATSQVKACTEVAASKVQPSQQQQQQQQQQQAMSAAPLTNGYCEPLPHKARQIVLQRVGDVSVPQQRPAVSDTSQERPPTLRASPCPSGERERGREQQQRQRSPDSETSGRPAPSGGRSCPDNDGARRAAAPAPALGGTRHVAAAAAAATLLPSAGMGANAAAVAAAAVSMPVLSPLFTRQLCQAPAQPVAPAMDMQAAWYAQHFASKSAAPASKQQHSNSQATPSAAQGMQADAAGASSAGVVRAGAAAQVSQRGAAQELEPSSRRDRAAGGSVGSGAVGRWWQDAGDAAGASGQRSLVEEARSEPAQGQNGGARPAPSGYDAAASAIKKVKCSEVRGQALTSFCDDMRHESSAAATTSGPSMKFGSAGEAAGGTASAAAAAAGFQKFKRHNGRKQQSKHASNRITANGSHHDKSNCSGGGSGSESVADQTGSPKAKRNTQTAESGDACKKARSAAAAAAVVPEVAPAGEGDAYKKARSAAGILLSLSGMSG